MLWFFEHNNESLRLETRYDNGTSEFEVVVQWPDGRRQTERLADLAAFRSHLEGFEQRLAADRWSHEGPPLILRTGWPNKRLSLTLYTPGSLLSSAALGYVYKARAQVNFPRCIDAQRYCGVRRPGGVWAGARNSRKRAELELRRPGSRARPASAARTILVPGPVVSSQHPYPSIVIPLGLFQVIKDIDVFKPDKKEKRQVRSNPRHRTAAAPLHYVVGHRRRSGKLVCATEF